MLTSSASASPWNTPTQCGIVYRKAFGQTHETIPQHFFSTPAAEEIMKPCLLETIDFETFRQTLKQVPSIHFVRPTSDNRYFEVAITESFLQYLVKNDFPIRLSLEMSPPYDVSMPTEKEKDVYGSLNAVTKARRAFIKNAMDATLTARHGCGLDQYYRDYANDADATAISWGFLLRDIMQFNPDDQRRAFRYCVLITLHSVQDLTGAGNLDFMERTEDDWLLLLQDLCFERALSVVESDEEMQLLSLVRAVFESALKSMPPMLPKSFDMTLSAKINIETLSKLFDCRFQPDAVPFGSFDEARLMDSLAQCDLFKDVDKLEVAGMIERIRHCVPVGFSNTESVPPHLVHTVRHETVSFIHDESVHLYSQVPLAQSRENDMLVFLCSCAFLPTVDAPLCDWVASSEGSAFSQQAMQGFYEKETMQQTILRVLALLSFENLLPPRLGETVEPVHGCYLSDFSLLLGGGTLDNRRALFRRMACSLRRVVRENSYPGFGRFFAVIEPDEPLHLLDGLSDRYWENKVMRMLDHEGARSMAWKELKGNLDHCDTEDGVEQSSDDQAEGDSFVII